MSLPNITKILHIWSWFSICLLLIAAFLAFLPEMQPMLKTIIAVFMIPYVLFSWFVFILKKIKRKNTRGRALGSDSEDKHKDSLKGDKGQP